MITKIISKLACMVFLISLLIPVTVGCFIGFFTTEIFSKEKQLKKSSEKIFNSTVVSAKFGIEAKGDKAAAVILEIEEKILFCRENGEVISFRSHKIPYLLRYSKQGKYIGLAEILQEPEKGINNGRYIFHCIDNKNQVLWEMTGEVEYGEGAGPKRPFISDKNGTTIMFQTPWVFDMYDPSGYRFKTVKVFEGKQSQLLSVGWYCGWSKDGNYFVICIQEKAASHGSKKQTRVPLKDAKKGEKIEIPAYSPESGNPWVILFDNSGDEIWRRSIPEYTATGVNISPDGRYIIAYGMTNTISEYKFGAHIFNREGKEIKSFRKGSKCTFSNNGKFGVLYDRTNVLFIDLYQSDILWEKKFDKYPFSCSISENGKRVAVLSANLQRNECMEPEISIFNHKGDKIVKQIFPNETCRIGSGDSDHVKMSLDGKQIILLFKDKITSFHIKN